MCHDKLLGVDKIVPPRGCWSYLQNYLYVRYIVALRPEITATEKDVKFLMYLETEISKFEKWPQYLSLVTRYVPLFFDSKGWWNFLLKKIIFFRFTKYQSGIKTIILRFNK